MRLLLVSGRGWFWWQLPMNWWVKQSSFGERRFFFKKWSEVLAICYPCKLLLFWQVWCKTSVPGIYCTIYNGVKFTFAFQKQKEVVNESPWTNSSELHHALLWSWRSHPVWMRKFGKWNWYQSIEEDGFVPNSCYYCYSKCKMMSKISDIKQCFNNLNIFAFWQVLTLKHKQ